MDTHDLAAFRKHLRIYIGVFVALLIATVLTVAVSYVHFGHKDSHVGNVTVALIIAVLKAFLVAGFFMHLVSEKRSIYTLLAATGVFCIGLMVLTIFAFYDPPEKTEMLHGPAPAGASSPGHHEP
jgi:cytochrome c oxidase subunit 4